MQLIESRRVSRRQKWLRRGLLLAGAAVVIGGWLGYDPAVAAYKHWKQQRALRQAKEFIDQRDAPSAKLALDIALAAVPGDLEAVRVAAEMLEQVGAPQAMRLRRMVAQAAPDSPEDAAALVMCCLRFRDVNAAKDALDAFRPEFADKPAALRAALAFAIFTDNAPVIDFVYGQLKKHYPQDDDLRISHSLLLLKHPDEAKRTAARRELETMAQGSPKHALRIHRELAGFALAAKNYADARQQFERVLALPEAQFSDRLQLANLDVLIEQKPFEPVAAQLGALAARSPADAAQFLGWLLVQRRAKEADAWIATLPAALRDTREVRAALPDIAAQLQDWERFSAALGAGAWGPMPAETLRLVNGVQAVQSWHRAELSRETWDLALESAGGNLGTLTALQRTAATWGWATEQERALWAIVRSFPDQTWAHQALFDRYSARRDTTGMRDVMGALQSSDPSVERYSHDWALLTLLVAPSTGPALAKDIMQKLHGEHPTNPNYMLGHAFALAQSRRGPEALAIVRQFTEVQRDYPPRQPYLAFIYGVARDAEGVARAEKIAQGATYLPEEQRLFVQAREELTRKVEPPKDKKAAPDKAAAPKP
jgi:hypothetical protein